MTLTGMPDIWEDGVAVEQFERSFFEDLAYRAGGTTHPAILKSILARLDDDTLSIGSEFEDALRDALAEEPWTDNDWY